MREGHFFHSEEMADWGPGEFQCPKRVPNHGEGAPPEHCNQVYREPYKKGNKIFMYTRGTGNSGADRNRINENTGRALFDELDGEMTDAIWQDIDHWCPDLAPPRLPPGPGDGELP